MNERGHQLALLGLEDELLAGVAADCGNAFWAHTDVSDRAMVDENVAAAVDSLGGLDVVVANAGIAAQLPLVGGDPAVMERTLSVNVLGAYYTLRAAGAHVSHPNGYALAVSSLGAAVHLPLMGAYSASKAAVEALGNTLRIELAPTGAKVGVAYFAQLDTDMTTRGFGTKAAEQMVKRMGPLHRVAPLSGAIDAVEKGIDRRARRIVYPRRGAPVLPIRMTAQRFIDRFAQPGLAEALEIARGEHAPLTTEQEHVEA